jgi:hypothetical protein
VNSRTCTASRGDVEELLTYVAEADEALVRILSNLAGHQIAHDLVEHLTTLAGVAIHVRWFAEHTLKRADEKANGARAEAEVTS